METVLLAAGWVATLEIVPRVHVRVTGCPAAPVPVTVAPAASSTSAGSTPTGKVSTMVAFCRSNCPIVVPLDAIETV